MMNKNKITCDLDQCLNKNTWINEKNGGVNNKKVSGSIQHSKSYYKKIKLKLNASNHKENMV